jgi:hypothetical protein
MAVNFAAAPSRRRQPFPKMLIASLALPFVILLSIVAFSTFRAVRGTEPPAPGHVGSLVWGDGIFTTRTQLKAWLALHGGDYTYWARHHPGALKLLLHPAKPAKKKPAAKK